MKHARKDYDPIQDPRTPQEGGIPPDEPVFLLRANDQLAAIAVDYWAALVASNGGDPEIVDSARQQANRMRAWPRKKMPDMPPGSAQ